MLKRTLKRSMLATLGALLLALAASAPAGAAWTSPAGLGGTATNGVEEPPGTAIDADGDSFYVWVRSDSVVQGRTRSAAGQLKAVMTLSKTGLEIPEASMPEVAANPRGDSLYAWLTTNPTGTQNLIQGRFRKADGTLGPIQNLVAQSADLGELLEYDLALSNDGSGVVAWHNQGDISEIKAKVRSATGRMGAVKTVATGGLDGETAFPEVEMDNGGEAVFAWQAATANIEGRIQARVMSPTGTLGPVKTLASPNATFGGEEGTASQLAVNPLGDAVFTWIRTDALSGKDVVEGRVLTDANVLKPTVKLSTGDTEVSEPEVDIANSGAAVFAWGQKSLTVGKVQLLGRSLSANNALGQTKALSGNANDVFHGHVGVDGTGNALFLWQDKDATMGKPVILSRRLTSAGVLGSVVKVADLESEPQGLELAVAANGKAAAAWLNGGLKRVEASFGP